MGGLRVDTEERRKRKKTTHLVFPSALWKELRSAQKNPPRKIDGKILQVCTAKAPDTCRQTGLTNSWRHAEYGFGEHGFEHRTLRIFVGYFNLERLFFVFRVIFEITSKNAL